MKIVFCAELYLLIPLKLASFYRASLGYPIIAEEKSTLVKSHVPIIPSFFLSPLRALLFGCVPSPEVSSEQRNKWGLQEKQ